MNFRSFLCASTIIAVGITRGYCQDASSLEIGSLSIGGELQLDYYHHRLGDNWAVAPSGWRGINKTYTHTTSTSTHSESVFGESLFLNVGFHPLEALSGTLDFEAINDYADRYWMPVNLEHRMSIEGRNFNWNRADITFTQDWWSLRYFRNVGHYNWSNRGDLFDLYAEQPDPARYLRVSGRSVPEGYQLNAAGDYGSLELIYGPEAIWDYRNGIYANYGISGLGLKTHLIYRDHIIPYGEPDEHMRSAEVSTSFEVVDNVIQLGALYQPFRLNRAYDYVEEVAQGQGYLGSAFIKKTGTTSTSDAFGGSVKLLMRPFVFFSDTLFQYTHLGLVAGNKQEFKSQFNSKITSAFTSSLEYSYRKPLQRAMPLVYEGTAANPGPAMTEPRGPNSPFWVGWGWKPTGWDNREASVFAATLTYDPTPKTWFYLNEANRLEKWNLNPDEDAVFSCALRGSLTRYPSSTDRLLYWDENGHMVWEGPMQSEPWASDGYLGGLTFIGKLFMPHWEFLLELSGGESPALNGFAYTTSTAKEKPVTGYFSSGITVRHGPYTGTFGYSQDAWGPEVWHQQFGETFDQLFQVGLARKFGDMVTAGIDYVGARENDHKYFAPGLGDYDEYHCSLRLAFGPIIPVFGSAAPQVDLPGEAPDRDITPPQVTLRASTTTFNPQDQSLVMEPYATDISDIGSWKIVITRSLSGQPVRTLSGDGQPPYTVEWDGKDDIYKDIVPEGTYTLTLTAEDTVKNEAAAEPLQVTVRIPPKVVIKEVVKEVPQEIKVTETERGLLVSMTSNVLFDSGKSNLKPGAAKTIQEVVKILKAYAKNNISVEGHTDATGSAELNKKLSEKRAQSVANQLIKSGIAAERITVIGYGKDKPVATNATPAGREANRRVEVIILK